MIREEVILPFMLLSGCFNAEFGPLEHGLGSCTSLHLIASWVVTWQLIQQGNAMWCIPIIEGARGGDLLLLLGTWGSSSIWHPFLLIARSTGEWVLYKDEKENNSNSRISGGVNAINSAARKPILCYGERRDHSSTGLFAQARSIDFLIPAVCIDFVISFTVEPILNSWHIFNGNSCGRWKPRSQE